MTERFSILQIRGAKTFVGLLFAITLVSGNSYAGQELSKDPIKIAIEGAKLAGGAKYCKASTEDVDLFVSHVQGKIAALSGDRYGKVIAQLEFKNQFTAAMAKEPATGCQAHMEDFNSTLSGVVGLLPGSFIK